MKIAIATDSNKVARHFGHCQEYTFYQIEEGAIKKREEIQNPGHQPDFLPQFLSEKEVDCIIAGGMGMRAIQLFKEKGIDTIVGVQGLVDTAIQDYLKGTLENDKNRCLH